MLCERTKSFLRAFRQVDPAELPNTAPKAETQRPSKNGRFTCIDALMQHLDDNIHQKH